ncbi:DUF3784 domain-containing protein [Lacinutrix jangbogonensis]|uniref:DUF3784 domain-containing protein n=1 Tax=Lacinutrix jangbogonensis TaxID=1469557 RepID=UPI000691B7E0|nr:DUF3784 domain-containing protein [Lacinutrix jangbogonensis]
MIYSQILVGLILIICGFLVKKHPNLIAGYNTMSQAEKDNVNIKELSSFLKQLLIGLGLFSILSYFLLQYFEIVDHKILYINTVALVIGLILGLVYSNTHKKFKT